MIQMLAATPRWFCWTLDFLFLVKECQGVTRSWLEDTRRFQECQPNLETFFQRSSPGALKHRTAPASLCLTWNAVPAWRAASAAISRHSLKPRTGEVHIESAFYAHLREQEEQEEHGRRSVVG